MYNFSQFSLWFIHSKHCETDEHTHENDYWTKWHGQIKYGRLYEKRPSFYIWTKLLKPLVSIHFQQIKKIDPSLQDTQEEMKARVSEVFRKTRAKG